MMTNEEIESYFAGLEKRAMLYGKDYADAPEAVRVAIHFHARTADLEARLAAAEEMIGALKMISGAVSDPLNCSIERMRDLGAKAIDACLADRAAQKEAKP